MQRINRTASRARQLGQGMTEYIIIVALIAIAAIGVFTQFGSTARSQMAGMAHELAGDKDASENINAAKNSANKADSQMKDKGMNAYNGNK